MKFENMSLEELWKLFPITFIDNNDSFKNNYLEEKFVLGVSLSR